MYILAPLQALIAKNELGLNPVYQEYSGAVTLIVMALIVGLAIRSIFIRNSNEEKE